MRSFDHGSYGGQLWDIFIAVSINRGSFKDEVQGSSKDVWGIEKGRFKVAMITGVYGSFQKLGTCLQVSF